MLLAPSLGGLPPTEDEDGLRGDSGESMPPPRGLSPSLGPITSSTMLPSAPPVANGSTKRVPFAPGGGHTPSSWKMEPESDATRVGRTEGVET